MPVGRCLAVAAPDGVFGSPDEILRLAQRNFEALVPLLFQEPNPMPIKHCLWRQGLIRSLSKTSALCRRPYLKRVSWPVLRLLLKQVI